MNRHASTKQPVKRRAAQWVDRLLAWFAEHSRPMPWRVRSTPYAVWVSEIMLQQTQVKTVIPFFERFMVRFPTIDQLAAADLQDVLKAWEGLGYYARARDLHKAAGVVVARHGGRLPARFDELKLLPGIGVYTAAAIASICFGEPVPVIDGNVVRVFTRYRGIDADSTKPTTRAEIAAFLARHIPVTAAGTFNQAAMELGALVCRPSGPDCDMCPLRLRCVARRTDRTRVLPVRPKRKPTPHYEVAACVIRKKGRVLIARRRADQMLGGLWEFPGGKRRPRETIRQAAHREIDEELGIDIEVGRELCVVRHAYSHFRITLHAFACSHKAGRPQARESDEVRWVPISRLRDYPFPAADLRIIEVIVPLTG